MPAEDVTFTHTKNSLRQSQAIPNCQVEVSVHAVGGRGTVPLGWALYLPAEWCADSERRQAKIPDRAQFQTKPQLGVELAEQAAGWDIRAGRCSAIRSMATTASCVRP